MSNATSALAAEQTPSFVQPKNAVGSFGSADAAIEFDNVSLRFIAPDGTATLALRNFSMKVAKGEFIAIVGPTGSGKSTTLNLITGLLKPTVGEVRIMGKKVDDIDPRIGFVFQADARERGDRPHLPWRAPCRGAEKSR